MIVFSNPGEIDMRSVSTFGLNVKEKDSPIGYFGTGMKYAIAVILRLNCSIKIFAGMNEYTFVAKTESFRNQDCSFVYLVGPDGKETQMPFTLQLGKNWEAWQAYRELYCNTADENGETSTQIFQPKPEAGKTMFVVKGRPLEEAHAGRDSFILNEAPIDESDQVSVHNRPGVYLHGIKISDAIYYKPIFGYNLKIPVKLTEDRTLANNLEAEDIVRKGIASFKDQGIIEQILTAKTGTFEGQISWAYQTLPSAETPFSQTLMRIAQSDRGSLNVGANTLAERIAGSGRFSEKAELTPSQWTAFEKARDFLIRHRVSINHPVEFVKHLGPNTWGQAKDGKIIISLDCFAYGVKVLAATIYEEELHLTKGLKDCTREMQNYLFQEIISLLEEKDGEPI